MRKVWLMLMAVLLLPSPSLAQPSEGDWLIGRWDAIITAFTGTAGGPRRTFEVTRVDADGRAEGLWYFTGQKPYPAQVTVRASQVKVITSAKSVVDLTREGESLVGTFVLASGISVPIKMVKWPGADHPLVGAWSGSWERRAAKGDTGQYHLTILAVVGDQVTGRYQFMTQPVDDVPFTGTLTRNTLSFGRTHLVVDGDQMEGETSSETESVSLLRIVRKKPVLAQDRPPNPFKVLVGVWTWRPRAVWAPDWSAVITIHSVSETGLVTAEWKDPHNGVFPFKTQAQMEAGTIRLRFGSRTKYDLEYDKKNNMLVGPVTNLPLVTAGADMNTAYFRRTQ